MNADFLAVLEFWEREKGINRDVLVGAVQDALLQAAKKAVGPARELRGGTPMLPYQHDAPTAPTFNHTRLMHEANPMLVAEAICVML